MFDVETDKSVMTADSMEEGYLAKIIVCSHNAKSHEFNLYFN